MSSCAALPGTPGRVELKGQSIMEFVIRAREVVVRDPDEGEYASGLVFEIFL